MPKRYLPEFRERAVRMVLEHAEDYGSTTAACNAVSAQLGISRNTVETPPTTEPEAAPIPASPRGQPPQHSIPTTTSTNIPTEDLGPGRGPGITELTAALDTAIDTLRQARRTLDTYGQPTEPPASQ